MTVDGSAALKTLLRERIPVCGPWVTVANQAVVEVMSQAGVDFLLVDGEHGLVRDGDLAAMALAAERHGRELVFRVRRNDAALLKVPLDIGIHAVMVPMVETAQDARQAVSAVKYPPEGARGIGPLRASNYYMDNGAYVADANRKTLLVVQIETVTGLENLDAIAGIEGIDCLYCGPSDLSASLVASGRAGDLGDAIAAIADAAGKNGKAAGIDVWETSQIAGYLKLGYSFFTQGMDLGYIAEGLNHQSSEFRKIAAAARPA